MSRIIRYTSGLANLLAIITIVIEVISGVAIFMLYTIVEGIEFILPAYWDPLLQVMALTLAVSFIISFFLLYTPLYEFLPYVTKVVLSSLLSILSLLAPVIIGLNYSKNQNYIYLQFAFLSIVIFLAETVIFYVIYAIRGRKMLYITRHRKALEDISDGLRRMVKIVKEKKDLDPIVEASNRAFRSWELIIKHELVERWDLSRIVFQSLFIALAFYVAALAIISFVIDYGYLIAMSVVVLFVFIIILSLVDMIQSERLRAVISR